MEEKTLAIYNVPALGRMEIVALRVGKGKYSDFRGKIGEAYVPGAYQSELYSKMDTFARGLFELGSELDRSGYESQSKVESIESGIHFLADRLNILGRVLENRLSKTQIKNKLRGAQ